MSERDQAALVAPDGSTLIAWGAFADGPLNPEGWEIWLGDHAGWRNADDMQDRRAGWGDLSGAPNGLRVVARPARPETHRLPRTARQEAGDLLNAGAKAVCMNCLHNKHEGKRATGDHYGDDLVGHPACFVAWNGVPTKQAERSSLAGESS